MSRSLPVIGLPNPLALRVKFSCHIGKGAVPMTRFRTSMAGVLAGVLVVTVAVPFLPAPVLAEGVARREVVGHAAELAGAENAGPASLSKNATIMDWDGKELRKGTNGWTCMPDNPNPPGKDP